MTPRRKLAALEVSAKPPYLIRLPRYQEREQDYQEIQIPFLLSGLTLLSTLFVLQGQTKDIWSDVRKQSHAEGLTITNPEEIRIREYFQFMDSQVTVYR